MGKSAAESSVVRVLGVLLAVVLFMAGSVQGRPYWCPDFNCDRTINFTDFARLAGNWYLEGENLEGDLDNTGYVWWEDMQIFADQWLSTTDCAIYPPDQLPYTTSFEYYQGYYAWANPMYPAPLDGQQGWDVAEGFAFVYGAYPFEPGFLPYQYAQTRPDTVVQKNFCGEGQSNHVRLHFIPAIDQKIEILQDSNVVASVWFKPDGYIHVLDAGTDANTGVFYGSVYSNCWYWYDLMEENIYNYDAMWTSLEFKLNWGSGNYQVYWNGNDGNDIAGQAAFSGSYTGITRVRMENTWDFYLLDSLSIGNRGGSGLTLAVDAPCACKDDALRGRIAVTGELSWDRLGAYAVMFCPAETITDESQLYDPNKWFTADWGWQPVPSGGVLGYWDTTRIPNGYYYLCVAVWNDLGVGDPYIQWKTVSDGYYTYDGPALYAVSGNFKGGSFYHQEEPDISMPWEGQIPFELRRTYNNNLRYTVTKPLRNGWTHNGQISLVEDASFNWETTPSGIWVVPSWDGNYLGFGYIWISYPDGSRRLFRHTTGGNGSNPSIYRPYPDDNTGEWVERWSQTTQEHDVQSIDYTLRMRDGTEAFFSVSWPGISTLTSGYGTVGWAVKSGIRSMSDRFGNTIGYQWDNDDTILESMSNGSAIIEFDVAGGYYTEARLVAGGDVLRTVSYSWDDANDVYSVIAVGHGVDPNGVYDANQVRESAIRYMYDPNTSISGIVYGGDLEKPSIGIVYDSYGRVGTRRDYVDADNFASTTYQYDFYKPGGAGPDDWWLKTVSTNTYGVVTAVQDEKGRLRQMKTLPADGCAVTDANSFYSDAGNPMKPTDTYEYFDGFVRHTWNDYNAYGDLIEQRTYLDASNYIDTQVEYHPAYSLPRQHTAYQGYNGTGALVQQVLVYGDADGTENPSWGKYVVKEKTLLSADANTWAVTSYRYYDNGLVWKKTDPNNFVTTYEYDPNGWHLKRICQIAGDTNEPVARYFSDKMGQARLEANPLGGVMLRDYDDFGRMYRERKYIDADAMTIADGQFTPARYEAMTPISTEIHGYDQSGNRTYEKQYAGGEVRAEYNVNGSVKRTTYQDGSYVAYGYDGRGLKMSEYRYDAVTGLDRQVSFSYDDMGRQTWMTWHGYGDMSNVAIVKATQSRYYGSGKKEYDRLYGYGRSLERETDYGYDILGRLATRTVAPGTLDIATTYGYDAAGNRTSVIDPNGSVIYAAYDNANRKAADYFAASYGTQLASAKVRTSYQYYPNDLAKGTTSYDTDGTTLLARSLYEYDGRSRIRVVWQQIDGSTGSPPSEPNWAQTRYAYSDTGFGPGDANNIRITDAENKTTSTRLDEFGRTVKTTYPSGDYRELEYNPDDTLKRKAVWLPSSQNKLWIDYGYDAYGRLVDVNYPDGGNVHYQRDGFGRKLTVEDNRNSTDNIGGSGQIDYGYDVLGRTQNITEQDGYVTVYSYAADGQKARIEVYSPGAAPSLLYDVAYDYDTAGRLDIVSEPQHGIDGLVADFDFDENGNRRKLSYSLTGSFTGSPAVTVEYGYSANNFLLGYYTTGGPTLSLSNTHVDGLGRLRNCSETITKTDSTTVNHAYTHQYDMLSRLKYSYSTNVAPSPALEYSYDYDRTGNMTHYTFNNHNPNYVYEYDYTYTGDQRTGFTGSRFCTYDLNGRQTSLFRETSYGRPVEYDWDGRIRHSADTYPDLGMDARYAPDTGARVWKKRNWNLDSYEHKYIVDTVGDVPQTLLILDANNGNAIVKSFVHASGEVLMQHDGDMTADRYFYLHDRLGSVREVINSSGTVANCYWFTPWGGCTGQESQESVTNWYGWCGYWSDDETESYYCNARNYYRGRFMSRDPVNGSFQEPMTLHPYLYCLDDPVNSTDPTGELSYTGTLTVVATWGSMAANMYGGYSLIKDMAKALSEGASIRNLVVTATVDVALNYGAGKMLGWAASGAGKLINKAGARAIENSSAKAILAKRAGKEAGKQAAKYEGHHLLPREFADRFKEVGLNIDDYILDLNKATHRLRPDGIHTGPYEDSWNGAWKQFFKGFDDARRKPSKQEILDQLAKMCADFGVE